MLEKYAVTEIKKNYKDYYPDDVNILGGCIYFLLFIVWGVVSIVWDLLFMKRRR